ncbi:DsrE family protein [Thiohalocapsa sp. ML1]|jgi:sulfur relay (sulfurtransferase) complex TusBCD TusD component (DsrE family)|uniref:DsrE family protein n=1 Tax=Thiohalocapsa sp. ML1 TaxID=1431688 RepID=UPI000732307D|nr:DsrE family protein [Thiohalocapsa sp. ML1]
MTRTVLPKSALLLVLLAALLAGFAASAVAEEPAADAAPLFINLVTDDPHRAHMALAFGKNQLQRGHPLTVFLNDRGVFIAAKQGSARFGMHQGLLTELMGAGAKIIVCPMCMKHYGVAEADLLEGTETGNPELTGGALFAPDTRTLTW